MPDDRPIFLPGNVIVVPGLTNAAPLSASPTPRAPVNPNLAKGGLKGK